MVNHPVLLLVTLVGFVTFLQKLAAHPKLSRLFNSLPLPFWCYVVPMAATTFGGLPATHPVYSFLSRELLPVSLVLLLIGTDLRALVQMGPLAAGLMLAGSFATVAGGLASLFLYQRWLPAGAWAGVGALSASWIGGSANLLAVKEALHVSDTLIGPIIIVDAIIAYLWMALLIWSSAWQQSWQEAVIEGHTFGSANAVRSPAQRAGALTDKAPIAKRVLVIPRTAIALSSASLSQDRGSRGSPARSASEAGFSRTPRVALLFGVMIAAAISLVAQRVAARLPAVGQVLNPQSWTIQLVTTLTLILSLTPLRKIGQAGISRAGTFALYVLLASIGARASFRAIAEAPVFLALGVTWILIHGLCLLLAGFLLKAPLGLIATASQANIGGPISAPIVGATFSPQLATLGLLMAILGNILGTYAGLATATLGSYLK